jgi:di/tricarboxylate transporter
MLGDNTGLAEVVVPETARIVGRSAISMNLLARFGVTVLGISRAGRRSVERVRRQDVRAGDILLLIGPEDQLPDVIGWIGGLPIAERSHPVVQRDKAGLAAGLFIAAIALASTGILYLPVALAACAVLMVFFKIIPLTQVYDTIEWPVIVLLGSLIPIGGALESSGGTALIADGIVSLSQGYSPVVVLTMLVVVTMTLSDVLNNTATTVIAGPIAIDLATRLHVNPDPFLMGVAIAASCAFLTPIGHKNNTLVMGPGGYRFGDYWRMGLPLEIIVIVVAIPTILWVWPL